MSDKLDVVTFSRTRGTWLVLVVMVCAWIATSVWAFRVAGTGAVSVGGSSPVDMSGNMIDEKIQTGIGLAGTEKPELENNVVDEARNLAELRVLEALQKQHKKAAEAERKLAVRQQEVNEKQRLLEQQIAANEEQRLAEQRIAEQAERLVEQQAVEEAKRLAEQQAAEEAERLAEQQAASEEAERLAEQQAAEEAERLAEQQAAEEAERLAEQQAAEEAERLAEQQAAEEAERLAEQQAAEEAQRVAEQQATDTPSSAVVVSLIGLLGEKEHLRRVSVGDWYQQQQQRISDQKSALSDETKRDRDLGFLNALSDFLRFESRNEVVGQEAGQVLERMLDPLVRYEESMAVVTVSSNEFKGPADNHRLSLERGRAIVSYFEQLELQASRFVIEVEQGAGLPYGTHRVRVSIEELEK